LEIRLPNVGLNGTLPNMSAFASLQKLFVNNNNLRGTVNLAGLEDTLEQINLGANDFTGRLPNMVRFSKIEWIFFGNNNWTGPLEAIGDLRQLTALQALSLSLTSNLQLFGAFPGVPTSLTLLTISGTNMSGNTIPPSLSSLVRLTSLRLSLTGLVGPVPSLAAMTNLTDLRLDGAGLTGTIILPASQLSRFSSASCILTSSKSTRAQLFHVPEFDSMRVHAENVRAHHDIVHIESTCIFVTHCRNHDGDRRDHRRFNVNSDILSDAPLDLLSNNDRKHDGYRNVRPRHLRRTCCRPVVDWRHRRHRRRLACSAGGLCRFDRWASLVAVEEENGRSRARAVEAAASGGRSVDRGLRCDRSSDLRRC
jgi:hypothetical protein